MRGSALFLVTVILLSGCVGDDAPEPVLPPTDGAADPTAPLDVEEREISPVTLAVAYDGDVGQGIAICEWQVTKDCQIQETKPYTGEQYVEANGTILGGSLTLSWTPDSLLYEELGFGAMTMTPGCGQECHGADLGWIEGTSPLTIDLPETDFVLEPEEVLHVYAYALTYREAGPVGAALDAGQPFRVEGSVTYAPYAHP